jgi:hypothetical protein
MKNQKLYLPEEKVEFMRLARDFLKKQTGVRVRLVGDSEDDYPMYDAKLIENQKKNRVIFNIKRHKDVNARLSSASEKTVILRDFVASNLLAYIVNTEIEITFDGYEDDPREVVEIPEVREWMRAVFMNGVPQALPFLLPKTFAMAEICCNKLVRYTKTIGPRGSPATASVEINNDWLACMCIAGMDISEYEEG